ncbi:PAC2 family protein [Dermacoccus barathri]|uniref:PAC2 family protein n=1 Tax=Dermacoccus barathri TaxID=322601 RepID=UPI001D0CEBA2|nr:PAC2 family protein [Dermacoccus barathri]
MPIFRPEGVPAVRRHFELVTETAPTVIVAFQGWNDVSGAALDAVDHLVTHTKARLWADIDPQDYYDFQVNQPRVDVVDGERRIIWRTTEVHHAVMAGVGDVLLVKGIEPSFRWKAFLDELLTMLDDVNPRRVVQCGVLDGEVAHTRPFPVAFTSPQPVTRAAHDARTPTYIGPTGIVGVLVDALGRTAYETLSMWVTVPRYALGGPQPKVSLTVVSALERLLETPLPLADLEEQARAWERGVSDLVAEDGEMASYVDTLENTVDVTELPEASGDVIAQEFEQFLRRRDDDQL